MASELVGLVRVHLVAAWGIVERASVGLLGLLGRVKRVVRVVQSFVHLFLVLFVLLVASLALVLGVLLCERGSAVASDASEHRKAVRVRRFLLFFGLVDWLPTP